MKNDGFKPFKYGLQLTTKNEGCRFEVEKYTEQLMFALVSLLNPEPFGALRSSKSAGIYPSMYLVLLRGIPCFQFLPPCKAILMP